jgi:hypothetical protein
MSDSSLGEAVQDDSIAITGPKQASISSLEEAVQDYFAEIDSLEKVTSDHKKTSEGQEVVKQALAVLIARDKVYTAFIETEKLLDDSSNRNQTVLQLIQLSKLDKRLRENACRYRWSYQVDSWRDSLDKPSDRWWWYSHELQSASHSIKSLILNFSGFIILGIAISLAINTSSKLLSANITLLGSSAIVFQSLLLYLASKTNLSSSSEWFDRFFAWLHLPKHDKVCAKLCFSVLVLLFVLLIDKGTIWYSQNLTKITKKNYQDSRHASVYIRAQADLERATKLNPENVEAINLLGQAYEELSTLTNTNLDKAVELYTLAYQKGNSQGSMNLARSFLLDSLRKEKEDKIQLLYNSLNILNSVEYRSPIQSEYKQIDKYLEDLKAFYEYNSIKAWVHLELYKIVDDEESKEESMITADSLIPVAITILEKLPEKENRPQQVIENPEQDSLAIKAFFADHINAYCLRAIFLKEALSNEQNIAGIWSMGKAIEIDPHADGDWGECHELLDTDKNKMFYEIDWFNEAELSL